MAMVSTTDELYQSFMASTAGSERAQRELRRLLSSCDKLPEQQSPVHLLPIDEMELRLHHIRELEDYWRQHFTRLTQRPQNQYRGFNDLEFSALIQMDYHYLRNMMQEGTTGAWDYCLNSLQVVPVTVKMCTSFYPLQTPFLYSLTEPVVATKKKPELDVDTLEVASALGGHAAIQPEPVSESSASERTTQRRKTKSDQRGKARRNSFYMDKRRVLDENRCLITGTRDPEICHIIPFAANSTEKARGQWANCISLVSDLRLVKTLTGQSTRALQTRLRSLFSFGIGVSDRHWNTISFAPTIHDWWGKAYFGLKYLGTRDMDSGNPDQIMALRVQFHWMVWREREIGQKPTTPLGRTVESIQAAFPEYMGRKMPPYCGDHSPLDGRPIVAISRPATGFNVETGDVFDIFVPKQHMQKMIMALNLQWALIKILAMAGGAEALDDIPNHPEFLDEGWRFPGLTAQFLALRTVNDKIYAQEERERVAASGRSNIAQSSEDGVEMASEHGEETASEDGVESTSEGEPSKQGTE